MPTFHSRHDYIRKTGKRISRGAWERMNKAYAVYPQNKLQVVAYDDAGKPMVRRCQTLVLLPETPKHHRKVTRMDRWGLLTKRARFPEGEEAGIQK